MGVAEEELAEAFVGGEEVGAEEVGEGDAVEVEFAEVLAETGAEVEELDGGGGGGGRGGEEGGEESGVFGVEGETEGDEPKFADAGPGEDFPSEVALLSVGGVGLEGRGLENGEAGLGGGGVAYDVEDVGVDISPGDVAVLFEEVATGGGEAEADG